MCPHQDLPSWKRISTPKALWRWFSFSPRWDMWPFRVLDSPRKKDKKPGRLLKKNKLHSSTIPLALFSQRLENKCDQWCVSGVWTPPGFAVRILSQSVLVFTSTAATYYFWALLPSWEVGFMWIQVEKKTPKRSWKIRQKWRLTETSVSFWLMTLWKVAIGCCLFSSWVSCCSCILEKHILKLMTPKIHPSYTNGFSSDLDKGKVTRNW